MNPPHSGADGSQATIKGGITSGGSGILAPLLEKDTFPGNIANGKKIVCRIYTANQIPGQSRNDYVVKFEDGSVGSSETKGLKFTAAIPDDQTLLSDLQAASQVELVLGQRTVPDVGRVAYIYNLVDESVTWSKTDKYTLMQTGLNAAVNPSVSTADIIEFVDLNCAAQ